MTTTLHHALASLSQIGSAINRIGSDEGVDIRDTLSMIAESSIQFVPGSIAVIYTYEDGAFNEDLRVAAGEGDNPPGSVSPRPDGMGHTAVAWRRRIVNYEDAGPDMHPTLVAMGVRASACFPLIVAEQVVGALYIYMLEDRRFKEAELLMLENVVNLAAMAIYHTRRVQRARADLERREEEIAQLRHAGLLLSSRSNLNSTLQAILQMALEITDAEYGIFRLVDRQSQTLYTASIAGADLDRPVIDNLHIDDYSVMGWVAAHQEPLVIPDLSAPQWQGRYRPLDRDKPMRSEVAVPLIGSGQRLEGVLNLESPLPYAFTERDSLLLQGLATQAVIAIQEARLLDALQSVTEWLFTRPLDEMLLALTQLAGDLLDAAAAAFWLREGEGLTRAVSSTEATITPAAARRALEAYAIVGEADDHWGYTITAPLITASEAEPLGAFSVYGVHSDSERDTKVLTLLAHYAALAVQNDRRQGELRRLQEQTTLAETFAALGDIAANLLHQLNNKIGTIPVRVEGIMAKSDAVHSDAYLATNLREIEISAREAMTVVRENLSVLAPIRQSPVTVARCVEEALNRVSLGDGLRVEQIGLGDLPPVEGSRQTLMLVFVNLIENAANAMQHAGTITIRGRTTAHWIEVTVSDTGPGIPAHLHDHIFELNYSSGAVNHAGKLGFGLWWVKTLITRLGGRISVESGEGATFRLQLPQQTGEAP